MAKCLQNNPGPSKIEVIYTDRDLIVLNKPAGISMHPALFPKKAASGDKNLREKTLVDFLSDKFPEIKGVGEDPLRPGLVHRLDKDTSGVVTVARNQKSFWELKNLFKNRLVQKTYLAIVCGKMKQKTGVISFKIGRLGKNPLKRGVKIGSATLRGAREAITEYKVLKVGEKYSLVELKPKTGRMHQLRVHLKSVGHPVACDKIYGGKNVCCPEGASRQMLHAKSISFSYPAGRKLFFEADAPPDFTLVAREVGFPAGNPTSQN